MTMEDTAFAHEVLQDHILLIDAGRMLDNNNAHEMVSLISEAQRSGHEFIIIDCSTLEFLSSAGVGAILGTIEASRSHGGDILLVNPSPTILHVLKVLDLVDFLTIKPDRAKALEACRPVPTR